MHSVPLIIYQHLRGELAQSKPGALASFDRYIRATQIRWKPAFIYGTFAILCCWLHLISAPLVIAPFLVTGIPALISRDWLRIYRLVLVGIPTAVGIFSLILPPLLNHPQALDVKLGKQPTE